MIGTRWRSQIQYVSTSHGPGEVKKNYGADEMVRQCRQDESDSEDSPRAVYKNWTSETNFTGVWSQGCLEFASAENTLPCSNH